MSADFKTVVMRNLGSAIMDSRSPIDEIPLGSFRQKTNFSVGPDGKLGRALGWQRLFKSVCPNNLDFHDQGATREPITMFFPSVSNEGVRRLFGATKSRLLVMNEQTETLDEIGNGFGADGSSVLTQVRFHAAELQNQVVFTNDFDPPQIHTLGDSGVAAITTLGDLGGDPDTTALTKAKVVVAWQGLMFLMNTVEDGDRYASRIRWSHLNEPDFWTPEPVTAGDGGTSIADFQDITYGDEILNAIPQGGYLYVFTNKGIERCSVSVNVDATLGVPLVSLSVVSVYREPKTQARCLAYPNAVVGDGTSFWFAGRDAIYRFTPGQDSEPERVEWVHRSTSVVFRDVATRIDKGACESPIMEFHPANNDDDTAGGEIHFSWPTYQPITTPEEAPATVDCTTYEAPDAIPGFGVNNQTLVIVNRKSADPTLRQQTTSYLDYGSTALTSFRSDKQGIGNCNQLTELISCNGSDWCLKSLNIGAGREMFSVETGLYEMHGYIARLIFVLPFERFEDRKIVRSFLVERTPEDENDTAVFSLKIGSSDSAVEPNPSNTNNCRVLWLPLKKQKIGCRYTRTADKYISDKVYPTDAAAWSFLAGGRYCYIDLSIVAADGSAPISGNCSISRFEFEARLE